MGGYLKTNAVIIVCLIICLSRTILGQSICDNIPSAPGEPLPMLPKFYSTNIRVNDQKSGSTVEIIRIVDTTTNSDSIEYSSSSVHVKYISIKKDDAFLKLKYEKDDTTCQKSDLSKTNRQLTYSEDGANLLYTISVVESKILPQIDQFKSTEIATVNDISGMKWVFCADVEDLGAEMKVTAFFSDGQWKPAYPDFKQTGEIVQIQIQGKMKSNGKEIEMTLDYYNYRPFQPKEEDFQLPELVFCNGYRTGKDLPPLPKHFSYQAEKIDYTTSGKTPNLSHRTVHYDIKAGLGRLIFDSTAEKSKTVEVSTIYDFNLGVQYRTDSHTACQMDVFNKTFDVISEIQTSTNSILSPEDYFLFAGTSVSYNGKYQARGISTDVYSAAIIRDKKKYINFWYFSRDRTQFMESQYSQINVLVKMIILPLSSEGKVIKSSKTELNFYNFLQVQPSLSAFDISPCFNATQSNSFVMTFPGQANKYAKGLKSTLQTTLHRKIQEAADVSRQRVLIDQIHFRETYLYVQFTLLDLPPIRGQKPKPDESELDTAVAKLKKSVSDGDFKISFTTASNVEVYLYPEPDSLKEFKGERHLESASITYNEGSVVGMAIGMTILGFLLGAVVVNLIISKKYGVSLFQKAGFAGSGARAFDNPLNESSM